MRVSLLQRASVGERKQRKERKKKKSGGIRTKKREERRTRTKRRGCIHFSPSSPSDPPRPLTSVDYGRIIRRAVPVGKSTANHLLGN